MFNKRDQQDEARPQPSTREPMAEPARPAAGGARTGQPAVIGPSIEIDGKLKGDEDLVVEGSVKGTVMLKQHTLTVGSHGRLEAEVYAHSILVDGTVQGDLYASERISIRKSARVEGNILSPRISLEDGAKFRGSIDMDAESEAFRKAFGKQAGTGTSAAAAAPGKSVPSAPSGGKPSSSKPATPAADEATTPNAQGSAA
jgi:cytoskeletal protein CcmA (bactofilin family)